MLQKMSLNVLFKLLLALALVLPLLTSTDAKGLKVGFYKKTCPKIEAIIHDEISKVLSRARSLAGPLLRMHFHDCFVNGCDGSVLLNGTTKFPVEKDSIPNLSLRGFNVIDGVKARLEKICPRIVSCSDILAVVARDVVALTNGPWWYVPTGRRDGKRSVKSDADNNLPPPFANFTSLMTQFFQPQGLSVKDLVVLSGGHTLGTSRCNAFTPRIYNFDGKGNADPSMDKNYVTKLKLKCSPTDVTTLVEMDPGSFKTFDNGYFKQVAKRRGLFGSDQALLENSWAKAYIKRQAVATNPSEFFKDFGKSMIKMGKIGVKTGNQGEIRKKCAFVN